MIPTGTRLAIFMLMTFHYNSSFNLFPELQTYISICLLSLSAWKPNNRHFKLN